MKGDKYDDLIRLLKDSKPLMPANGQIEEAVLTRLSKPARRPEKSNGFFDYLFGWTDIAWIRYALVTVSLCMAGLFIYQQSLILRRINLLEEQTIVSTNQNRSYTPVTLDYRITNRLARFKLKQGHIPLNGREIEDFLNSYSEMEKKYNKLIDLIESDPDLKEMLLEKLSEKDKKKLNL